MKKICLDLGEKSCGIAISDDLNIIAHSKENLKFESKNWKFVIQYLEENYFKKIDEIIIGYPLLPSGDKSKTTFMIEEFKNILSKKTKHKIILFDEFGSTKKAHDIMIELGLSRAKRKKNKDRLAAAIILQEYLDRIKNGKK